MDARAYFLELYRHAHGAEEYPTAPASIVLNRLTPEQQRATLPGHNSVAWNVWHIARGEDWGINTMLRGAEQVLTAGDWNRKMGISEPGFGFGMTDEGAAQLSKSIDLAALRAYFDAVTAETLRFIETFDFDKLNAPLDVETRLSLAPDALEPQSESLRRLVGRQPATNRWFLSVLTIQDVEAHFYEAVHAAMITARVGSGA
jgi:hypothetical protein